MEETELEFVVAFDVICVDNRVKRIKVNELLTLNF